jgi:hypothetical protein
MSTEATLAHHLQAIGEGVDSVMRDYGEGSLLFTQQGPLRGLVAIRGFFEQFINGAPPELFAAVRMVRQDVVGEVAYIVWSAEPFISLATDTFVVRDGKIVVQSFAMVAPQPA